MNVVREHESSEIITSLYRELLRREPDEEGLRVFGERLRQGEPLAAVGTLLHDMNGSEEAGRVRIGAVLEEITRGVLAARGAGARPVVGLGTHCYTATLLKSAGLKRTSYPFDWLFSSPEMVAHCLHDDFATFLDRRLYEYVPPERRRDGPDVNLCDHAYYRDELGVSFVFNHRNPLEESDYAYVVRCVERFREVARRCPAFLLTTFTSEYYQRRFDEISRALRAYAPGAELVYVVVAEAGSRALPVSRLVSERDSHALVELIPGSPWRPLWFDNPLDDISVLSLILDRV